MIAVDLPREIGWRSRWTATRAAAMRRARQERDGVVWVPCSQCWGQGRALEPRPDGSYTVLLCLRCLGVGQTMEEER